MSDQKIDGVIATMRDMELSACDVDHIMTRLIAENAVDSMDGFVAAVAKAERVPLIPSVDNMQFEFRTDDSDDSVASTFTSYGHDFEVHYSAGDYMLQRAAVALQLAGNDASYLGKMTGVSLAASTSFVPADLLRMTEELVEQTLVLGFWQRPQRSWALLPIAENCMILGDFDAQEDQYLVHPVFVSSGILRKQITIAEYALALAFYDRASEKHFVVPRCDEVLKHRPYALNSTGNIEEWFEELFGMAPFDAVLSAHMAVPSTPLNSSRAERRKKAVMSGNATVRAAIVELMSGRPEFTAADVSDYVTGVLSNASIAQKFRSTDFFAKGGREWHALDTRRSADMFHMCAYLVHHENHGIIYHYLHEALGPSIWRTVDGRCVRCGVVQPVDHDASGICDTIVH